MHATRHMQYIHTARRRSLGHSRNSRYHDEASCRGAQGWPGMYEPSRSAKSARRAWEVVAEEAPVICPRRICKLRSTPVGEAELALHQHREDALAVAGGEAPHRPPPAVGAMLGQLHDGRVDTAANTAVRTKRQATHAPPVHEAPHERALLARHRVADVP